MRERSLLRRLRARTHGDERGFTMIEIMVAIMIFAILITGVTVTMGTSLNLVRNNRNRSIAANLAAQEMDTVRAMAGTDFTNLDPNVLGVTNPLVQEQVVGTPPVTYTISREAGWIPKDATGGACDVPAEEGESPAYLRVSVSVSWPNMAGVPAVESQTVVAPPVGTYNANTGHVAVKVMGRDGQPEGNIPISIAGPASRQTNTNSDGCAFFAFLPAGDYSVTASAPGYVDYQGVQEPVQPASVTVGATISKQFNYDVAAGLLLSPVGQGTGALAQVPADAGAVHLNNTHFLPPEPRAYAGSGSPRAIAGLFPYAEGYEAWIGDCEDAGLGKTIVGTDPGAQTSADVSLPDVRVTVLQTDIATGDQVPAPDVAVAATHAADLGCPAGASHAWVTDAAGSIVFALPAGAWQITVGGGTLFSGLLTLDPTLPPADGDGAWPYDITATVP